MFDEQLREVFGRTAGHCHFCGDRLSFNRYGKLLSATPKEGAWELDHVIQRAKGGLISRDNCLPACVRCNRLRWHRRGLRQVIMIGLIGMKEIGRRSDLGRELLGLLKRREGANLSRRRRRQRARS